MGTIATPQASTADFLRMQLDDPPPLPPALADAISLLETGPPSERAVRRLFESDPAGMEKIRSRAARMDASLHGVDLPPGALLGMLGTRDLWRILLAARCVQAWDVPDAASGFDVAAFWRHGLATACAASRLVARKQAASPEAAFACGLLHDMGKLILARRLPRSYRRAAQAKDRAGGSSLEREQAVFGLDHTAVGRRAALAWRLPNWLAECIWLHHHPPEARPQRLPTTELISAVRFADALDHRYGNDAGNHVETADLVETMAAEAGLVAADVEALWQEASEEAVRLAEWAGLCDPPVQPADPTAMQGELLALRAEKQRLEATNSRLQTAAACLEGVSEFAASQKPRAPFRQACAAAAAALRGALRAETVAVLSRDGSRGWIDLGIAESSGVRSETQLQRQPADRHEACDAALLARAQPGTWLQPIGESGEVLAAELRGIVRAEDGWLFPLVHEQACVAVAVFTPRGGQVASLNECPRELACLSAVLGWSLVQARRESSEMSVTEDWADVSRRTAERQSPRVAEKSLEMIAEMAAGAAHELNTPLTVISGRAQQLLSRTRDASAREQLTEIVEQAGRCSELLTELHAFAQPPPPRPQKIDMGEMINAILEERFASGQLRPEQVRLDLSDAVAAHADSEHVRQVLNDLVENAIAATTPRDRFLTVKTSILPTDDAVVIRLADNGRGMTPEVRERAMAPFFSNRSAGRGRGLGLSRASRLAALNGGRLALFGAVDRGTTAELTLPSGGSPA